MVMSFSTRKSWWICVIFLNILAGFSFAQIDWTKYPGNPVLLKGGTGAWDEEGIYGSSILYEAGTFRMWYSGWTWVPFQPGIGYASSTDGIIWEKHLDNPLLAEDPDPSTIWDTYISDPFVMLDTDEPDPVSRYKMWFGANDGQYPDDYTQIGYATSPDGINWVRYPVPVLSVGPDSAWDSRQLETPFLLRLDDIFHMWYCAVGEDDGDEIPEEGELYQIGYAYSPDGINWVKYDDPTTTSVLYAESDPVINPGDWTINEWDGFFAGEPSVIFRQNAYEMWYVGTSYLEWPPDPLGKVQVQIGYATAVDCVHWIKWPDNPVLIPGPGGAWDSVAVHTPFVCLLGSEFHMWFSSFTDPVNLGLPDNHIGYATSPVTGIQAEESHRAVGSIAIHPNPFTCGTTLHFCMKAEGKADLCIYDESGRLIRELIDGFFAAGEHSVFWNGSDNSGRLLPSGLYFCLLKMEDNQVQSGKILLLNN